MFTDWLVEAYHLRLFLQLSEILHYTTLQKFTDRINITIFGKNNFIIRIVYEYKIYYTIVLNYLFIFTMIELKIYFH